MEQVSESTQQISLTPQAAERVRRLMAERELEHHALRVFVSGGGCSGMQYGMAMEAQPRPDDIRMSFDKVDLVIDPLSMNYLAGSTIDYIDDLMGGGFQINNPNAVASCGCGHSFRTEGDHQHTHAGGACGCS
jgi:iron-sulfur cluster assembly protein